VPSRIQLSAAEISIGLSAPFKTKRLDFISRASHASRINKTISFGEGGPNGGNRETLTGGGSAIGILDRERLIAQAGFNRLDGCRRRRCASTCASAWPTASRVFWLPLSRALGVTQAKGCPDMTLVQELFTTTCDWRVASMGWMYTLFFVLLGVSARDLGGGGWLERAGARARPAWFRRLSGPAASCSAPSHHHPSALAAVGLAPG